MRRTSVNPWDWGLAYSMDQGEIIEGLARTLHCSGQVAVVPAPGTEMGIKVLHPGDMRGQIAAALDNIDAILAKARMGRENVLTLRFFTTDVDAFLANYDVYADWIAPTGLRPPQSLLGVSRLVAPDMMVEIEAVAGS